MNPKADQLLSEAETLLEEIKGDVQDENDLDALSEIEQLRVKLAEVRRAL